MMDSFPMTPTPPPPPSQTLRLGNEDEKTDTHHTVKSGVWRRSLERVLVFVVVVVAVEMRR